MNILVTGSSGMIGTRLSQILVQQGHTVIGVDKKENIWDLDINKLTLKLDICNFQKLQNLLSEKQIDYVVHLAANARVYNLVVDPSLAKENIDLAYNIFEFCRLKKIKGIIFSSSREVYGEAPLKQKSESEVFIERTESPYTASKIAAESLLRSYSKCYNLDFIILRFSNVYGMYDKSDRLIPKFIDFCSRGKDLTIYGQEKTLDFTYIDDTVQGIVKAIKNFDEAKNDVYNIATGIPVKLVSVAEKIKAKISSGNSLSYFSNRVGEINSYWADITKAKNKLDYAPQYTIDTGLSKTIEWYKNN